jgi:hypothetical protein
MVYIYCKSLDRLCFVTVLLSLLVFMVREWRLSQYSSTKKPRKLADGVVFIKERKKCPYYTANIK